MNTERRAALRHLNAFLHECPAEAEAGAWVRITCFYEPRLLKNHAHYWTCNAIAIMPFA